MRISVIIIVFNLEDYVAEAIESVLQQTRPADEIIVVDDCSRDTSAERIKAYGDKVTYHRMPVNSGALCAALYGVKAASGDIVCMLDGDDFWQCNKLEVVERAFTFNPALMLLSHDHVRVTAEGTVLDVRDDTHVNISSILAKGMSGERLSDAFKATILEQRGYWLGSAYSFRRASFDVDKFEQQLAAFDQGKMKGTYLDLVIAPFLVLSSPAGEVGYTADTRFFYRIHDKGSMSGNFTPDKAIASALKARAINELIDLILRANHAGPSLLRRRALLLQEYDYLVALYRNRIAAATAMYLHLLRKHWNGRQIRKETKRLVAVAALGPDRFLRLKA